MLLKIIRNTTIAHQDPHIQGGKAGNLDMKPPKANIGASQDHVLLHGCFPLKQDVPVHPHQSGIIKILNRDTSKPRLETVANHLALTLVLPSVRRLERFQNAEGELARHLLLLHRKRNEILNIEIGNSKEET